MTEAGVEFADEEEAIEISDAERRVEELAHAKTCLQKIAGWYNWAFHSNLSSMTVIVLWLLTRRVDGCHGRPQSLSLTSLTFVLAQRPHLLCPE